MATQEDMGDGDQRFGMDLSFHSHDYHRLHDAFKSRAASLSV